MNTIFVLIVTVWSYGGGAATSMQEFSSLDNCNAAKQVVLADAAQVRGERNLDGHIRAQCLPK